MPLMAEYVAPEFKPKNENALLRRYMTFDKYVSTLQNNALFFTRPYLFDDLHEGVPPEEWFNIKREQMESFFPGKENELFRESLARGDKHSVEFNRKVLTVNCWHMSEHESMAMWNIYAARDMGIALVSSCRKLQEHVPNPNVVIGAVQYTDKPHYNDVYIRNAFSPLLFKRLPFEYEHEFRALKGDAEDGKWWNPRMDKGLPDCVPPNKGQWVPADMSNLVTCVEVSPYAKTEFVDVVANVTKRYGYKWQVIKSTILDEPNWAK